MYFYWKKISFIFCSMLDDFCDHVNYEEEAVLFCSENYRCNPGTLLEATFTLSLGNNRGFLGTQMTLYSMILDISGNRKFFCFQAI